MKPGTPLCRGLAAVLLVAGCTARPPPAAKHAGITLTVDLPKTIAIQRGQVHEIEVAVTPKPSANGRPYNGRVLLQIEVERAAREGYPDAPRDIDIEPGVYMMDDLAKSADGTLKRTLQLKVGKAARPGTYRLRISASTPDQVSYDAFESSFFVE